MRRVIYHFDRDLRLADNPDLLEACARADQIIPAAAAPRRINTAQDWWRICSIQALAIALADMGTKLMIVPEDQLPLLASTFDGDAILSSRDDNLVHKPASVLKADGTPYRVFTAFYKRWQTALQDMAHPQPAPKANKFVPATELTDFVDHELPSKPDWTISLEQFWRAETVGGPGEHGAKTRLANFLDTQLKQYKSGRDMLGTARTSRLSPALHHGELSPRQVIYAVGLADPDGLNSAPFIRQLAWREFAAYILHHFPHTASQPMNQAWHDFPWRTDDAAYRKWCRGKTGQSLVDAAMQELWQTGQMHNRARMITASYLTKNLGITWRDGAEWFNQTLVDADMANNTLGWQWVAGCGVDAAPYFRIFNPDIQAKKFDPDGAYRARWLGPNWQDNPISSLVDLKISRAEALARYQQMRGA